MIIYVITKGKDAKYRICTVTTDKKEAKKLCKLFSDDGCDEKARIEEFDSNAFSNVFDENCKSYYITATYDCGIVRAEEESVIDYNYRYNEITKNLFGNFVCRVIAKDEKQAKRIFRDVFSLYKYKLEDGEITE